MSNLEFVTSFTNLANEQLGESAQSVLDEFDSLDPREAHIVYRAFNSITADGVEQLHAKTRIRALVASGAISQQLADIATGNTAIEEEPVDVEVSPEAEMGYSSYDLSRTNMLSVLSLFETVDGEGNLIDPDGEIQYRVAKGYPKANIEEFIKTKSYFSGLSEAATSGEDVESVEGQLNAYKFSLLQDALEGLEDSEIDMLGIAKERVAKYDDGSGALASLIDGGASSKEILETLDDNALWKSDAEDFLSRDYVDSPRDYQRVAWDEFLETVNAIKDLDNN